MQYTLTVKDYSKLEELISVFREQGNTSAKEGYESGAAQDGHHDEGYQLSLRETALHDRRIRELEEIRNNCKVVEAEEQDKVVKIGNIVFLEYPDGRNIKAILCGYPFGQTVYLSEISISSPIGKAIMGAKKGEIRQVNVGGKKISVTVTEILFPSQA